MLTSEGHPKPKWMLNKPITIKMHMTLPLARVRGVRTELVQGVVRRGHRWQQVAQLAELVLTHSQK